MRHARESGAFGFHGGSFADVAKAVQDDFKSIDVTREELLAAISRVLGMRDDESAKTAGGDVATDWARILARLEAQTGIDAEKWMWDKSTSYALRCYADLHSFASAYSSARRIAPEGMKDELDRAMERLMRVKLSIAARVKASGKRANERDNTEKDDAADGEKNLQP